MVLIMKPFEKKHLCLMFQKHIFLTVNLIQGQGDM